MPRERQLAHWEAYLGPVAVAQFVERGWIREWPLTITAEGVEAVQRERFGVWNGTAQRLPYEATTSERGAAHWEGRTTR